MSVYVTLLFPAAPAGAQLKQWLMKMGSELHAGDPLFTYYEGGREARFTTPGAGTLKVYLCREAEALQPGAEVAVVRMAKDEAHEVVGRGLGKILSPEEFKSALEHAEAASIRLPPEEISKP